MKEVITGKKHIYLSWDGSRKLRITMIKEEKIPDRYDDLLQELREMNPDARIDVKPSLVMVREKDEYTRIQKQLIRNRDKLIDVEDFIQVKPEDEIHEVIYL